MDLPKDCIIKICLEMDLSTLAIFIQTCKGNYNITTNIFNYKKYKDEHYPILLGIYCKKREILDLLKNVKRYNNKTPALTGGTGRDKFKLEYLHNNDIPYHIRYSKKYDIYHKKSDFEDVMSIPDPNIKLEELRQLIYNF